MDFLKKLFDGKPLTFEELSAKVSAEKLNVVDLSTGEYVDKRKYDRVDGLYEKLKGENAELDKRFKELEAAKGGDEALKTQLEKIQADLKAAQAAETAATEKLTQRERLDAAMQKVGGDRKLARLLTLDAAEKVTDKVDFEAAMDEVMKADPQTYTVKQDKPGETQKPGGAYMKTPGSNDSSTKTDEQKAADADRILRAAMGLPVTKE